MDLKRFNEENLSSNYSNDFLKNIFDEDKKESYFKDSSNGIQIRILRD